MHGASPQFLFESEFQYTTQGGPLPRVLDAAMENYEDPSQIFTGILSSFEIRTCQESRLQVNFSVFDPNEYPKLDVKRRASGSGARTL